MKKNKIIKYTKALLDSANNRDTEQGIIVYNSILNELKKNKIDSYEVENILLKLNKALTGIEAYGDLTAEEFYYIKKLREISDPL